MEQRIMEVLRRMQPVLEDEEFRELKNVLHMVFAGCDVAQKTEVQCVDDSWRIDLEDYFVVAPGIAEIIFPPFFII